MNDYSAHVEVDVRKQPTPDRVDELMEAFAPYSGAIGMSERGFLSVQMSVAGATMPQAAVTTIAVTESFMGAAVVALELMTEAEFTARLGWDGVDDDELLTVPQAAELLGVSRQAVGERVRSKSIPAERHGRDWLIPRKAIEGEARRRAGVAAAIGQSG